MDWWEEWVDKRFCNQCLDSLSMEEKNWLTGVNGHASAMHRGYLSRLGICFGCDPKRRRNLKDMPRNIRPGILYQAGDCA